MTALSLILSITTAFMPTIDGARQTLPYIETDLPYVLGISVPPPDVTCITVIQDGLLWQGLAQGTFTIGTITDTLPIYIYSDNLLQYTIVPEPASLLICLCGVHMLRTCRRKQKG